MKYSYVARQPILDDEKHTIGYELLFRDGPQNTFPEVDPELATCKLLSDHILSTQYRTLGDKLGFVNFPYESLINLVPTLFPPHSLVVEVLENCPPDDKLFQALKHLHNNGYRIALDDFSPTPEWKRFYPYVSMIKFDLRQTSLASCATYIQDLQPYKIEFLAEKVETYEEFRQAKAVGFQYFQGYFFSKPEMLRKRAISPSFITIVHLCKEISAAEVDYNEIERLFTGDVTLSYKLLTFVNSGYTLRTKISSFHQALVYLGEERLRRFISLVALTSMDTDKPDMLYITAIQRARCCELLLASMEHNNGYDHGQAFLSGMFSLLDSILDQPIEEIVASIPLDESIQEALLHRSGLLGELLLLVIAYEKAAWQDVQHYRTHLKLNEDDLARTYQDAVDWAQELMV